MRHSGKAPQLWQKLDAKDSTEDILKRRREQAAKRRTTLALAGWSPGAIEDGGAIEAYEGSQDRIEMGLPKNLSERKSKRKRESPKSVAAFWSRYVAV